MTKPSKVTDANVEKTKKELAERFGVDAVDVYTTLAERGRDVGGEHEAYYYEVEFEVRIPLAGMKRERVEAEARLKADEERKAKEKAAADAKAAVEKEA